MQKSYSAKLIFTFLIVLLLNISLSALTSQSDENKKGVIKGQVIDSQTNEVLPGANVFIKATKQGASTDINGNFTISNVTPGKYTLTISFVGYKKATVEVTVVKGKTVELKIPLTTSALNLEELVVIGSTIRATRKELGNTVTTLKAKELEQAPVLMTAIQGKIPGAQVTQNSGDPAGGFSITLRGVSSIYGSSDPLYVLDGVVISNESRNVTNLNVGAPNTVIGQNRLADINPNDIQSIEVIPGGAAAAIYGSRAANGVVLITSKKGTIGAPKYSYSIGANINQLRKKVFITTYGKQFGSAEQRLYPIAGVDPNTGALTVGRNFSTETVDVKRYDYQDEIFQIGAGVNNNLSISGGSNSTQYFGSISKSINEGIVKNTLFDRTSARLRLHQEVAEWINFDFGVNYIHSFSKEKPDGNVFWSPVNSINITNNIWDITERDEFGNLKSVEPTRVNPLSIIETFKIEQNIDRIIADGQIHLAPYKGLTIDYVLGIDSYSQDGIIFIPPYPYSPVNSSYYNDGYASEAHNRLTLINNDLNIRYQLELSPKITATTYAGFNAQLTREHFQSSEGRNLAPFVENISGASNFLGAVAAEPKTNIWGYYLQETFDYNKSFYLTLAGRIDGSTAFGKNERANFYPKVSASYFISEEDFWKNSKINEYISSFRLRTSWGQSGNLTAIGPFTRFTQYNPGQLTGITKFNIRNQKGNEDIKPERSDELEFGLDFGLFNDRVNLIATYYTASIEDLIIPRTLAASEGALSIIENVGKLENKGFELLLSSTPLKTPDMEFNFFTSYSQNRNKVVETLDGFIALSSSSGAPVHIKDGEPLGIYYGTYFARDASGNIITNDKGLPQMAKDENGVALRKKIGDPNPDYIFSVGANFRYKKFTVGVLVDGMQGFDVFDADKRTRQGVGIGEYSEKELKGEIPRGWIWSIYPILEWRIEDGSFVKIREISLSYDFDNIFNIFDGGKLTLVGRNLFSFDDFYSYDPEINSAGQASYVRYNFGTVPIPRTYSLLLTLNF